MSQQHAFILKAKTRPEMAEAFETLFRAYVEPSRQEPGCIEYHMLRDQQDPSLFVFYEVWADKAALDVHSALPHMVEFFESMTEPEAAHMTIEKLVGVYRVLIPHKIAAYTYHRNGTSEITDMPTIRILDFILQDEFNDWREGEMLIQSMIESPEELERAMSHQTKLEKIMLAAGGIAGPGSIGNPYVEVVEKN